MLLFDILLAPLYNW